MKGHARALALLAACATACGGGSGRIIVPTVLAEGIVDLSQAQSFQLWVLDQVGRDNVPIQCESLLARTLLPGDANVIKLLAPIEGNFASDTITVKSIPVGQQNRIFFLELFEQPGQLGTRVGAGCAQSVSISGSKPTEVDLAIVDPAAP